MTVAQHRRAALAGTDGDGGDLAVETPLAARRLATVLRFEGVGVLLLAGDVVLAGQGLGGAPHQLVAHRIEVTVDDVRVVQGSVAHTQAPAGVQQERHAAHRLHPAGQHDAGLAAGDGAGGVEHGLHPRQAGLVDGEGRALDREPRGDGHLARRIRAVAGLAGHAE